MSLPASVVARDAGAGAPTCASGRFATATPLLPGSAPSGDVVEIAGAKIAIEGACGPADVKRKATAAGTRVRATFQRCRGVPGKVKLRGVVDPSCQSFVATLTAAKTRPRWKVTFSGALDASIPTCAYLPGAPVAQPPAELDARRRRLVPDTPRIQEGYFLALWNLVATEYLYPDFHGVDWEAVRSDALAQIRAGLSLEAFYELLAEVIEGLGDEHSYFAPPEAARALRSELDGGEAFVGIGIAASRIEGENAATVLSVYPRSPAAAAGLAPHDVLVAVNGGPVFDEDGGWLTPEEEGASYELTFERPGGGAQTVTVVRTLIGGFRPLEHCLIQGTRIAYLSVPTFFDATLEERVRAILRNLTAAETLDGLVLDLRVNAGGSAFVALPILGFFTDGLQGEIVDRRGRFPLEVEAEDVGGSQSVPLVVLAGEGTVSFGELATGMLQLSGRATVVGEPTAGNTEGLYGWIFRDGSEVWLAAAAFDPVGPLPAGAWEGVGVAPDVAVPSAWHLFTAADDPGLAQALELLTGP